MKDSIIVKGAKENNLKNIDVEIPMNELTVIAGVSGSGKSSLAFNVVYGEGQRRLMDAFSTGMKRFASYVKKPDVDSVTGLSPVIAVRQKTTARNPRSTVGTMTDILDYIRVLYANEGVPHCPYCGSAFEMKTAGQIAEHFSSFSEDTIIEVTAPVFKSNDEEYADIVSNFYNQGYNKIRIDGILVDIGEKLIFNKGQDYRLEVVIDQVTAGRSNNKQLLRVVQHALNFGEGLICYYIIKGDSNKERKIGCKEHNLIMGECSLNSFVYNNPESACPTCFGLGTDLIAESSALIHDETLSIIDGAIIKEAFQYDKNSFKSMLMSSLAKHYNFSLYTPFKDLPDEIKQIIFWGNGGEKIPLLPIENATRQSVYAKRVMEKNKNTLYPYEGLINTIERSYKDYKKKGVATPEADAHYKSIMTEQVCIDCNGSKLKKQRLLVKINGKDIDEISRMSVKSLILLFDHLYDSNKNNSAKNQVLDEIIKRLQLLKEAGLGYVSLNRKTDTLSGGELQRVKLTSHIGSGLRGITYVLDEPSIGLHPKDNMNLIKMMMKLKDIGNTVIVVEHDLETICHADYVIEIGPRSGINGGRVIAQGSIQQIQENKDSIIGKYLNEELKIEIPMKRRFESGKYIEIKGARENNLKNIDVKIPLGILICVTGVSGSGKSTLINEILYKKIYSILADPKTRFGKHDHLYGIEYINRVVNIDQTPIGKNCRSIPATYMGFYDQIRSLFASEQESKERKYTISRFSFNQKGGRCEECQGEGIITTNMHFMPSVESTCRICNGSRYNRETLEIQYNGKNIAEVLDMTVEEAMVFFKDKKNILRKLEVMNEMGLDYLKLGQPSTSLSGGESQRIKIAFELSRITTQTNNLYILDEPTTGLHIADIQKLLNTLNKIVDMGNTVLVIEHSMEFANVSDYIIDLGPEGGIDGGELVACGTPEDIMNNPRSHTGKYLNKYINFNQ